MKLHKLLGLLFCTALLGACTSTTSPLKLEQADVVPVSRTSPEFAKYQNPSAGASKVIVVRDSGMLGAAGTADLYLNGKVIAAFRPSESLVFYLGTGTYLIGVGNVLRMPWESAGDNFIEQELVVIENSEYFYRLTIDVFKGLTLHRSSIIR